MKRKLGNISVVRSDPTWWSYTQENKLNFRNFKKWEEKKNKRINLSSKFLHLRKNSRFQILKLTVI